MMRRLATVAVAVLTLTTVLAVPASASVDAERHSDRQYLALGDSLAFGSQPVPVTPNQGYVYQLHAALRQHDPRLRLRNLGCPGETSTSMLTGGRCDYGSARSQVEAAVAFLRAHGRYTSLVTIDIGGNDVNACARGGTIDEACVAAALRTLVRNLAEIVFRLRAAAPHVKVAGMTYYDPYLAAWLAGPAGQDLARRSVGISQRVNGVLGAVYRIARIRVADVGAAFATTDLTTQVPLPGVGPVPLAVARICLWTWMCSRQDIHANTAGYGVIAATFEAIL